MSESPGYATDEVRTAVAAVTGSTTDSTTEYPKVGAVEPIAEGHNETYAVTFADGREAVLKIGTGNPGRFRVEPRVLRFVAARTDVPVPRVLGSAGSANEGALDHPYVLLSRPPGETYECDPHGVGLGALGRVCEEAGRHLGLLHTATRGTVDAFGPLGPDDLEAGGVDAVNPDGGDSATSLPGVALSERYESWPTMFRDVLAYSVEQLDGTRFADLCSDLDAAIPGMVEDLAAATAADPPSPVVAHGDYRLGNLLLTPDADAGAGPVTRSVIDWGGVVACAPGYELVKTAALLTGWPGFGGGARTRLCERLYDGYAAVRADPREDDTFAARRRVYRLQTRLNRLRHVDAVTERFPAAVVEEWAATHRDALRAACEA